MTVLGGCTRISWLSWDCYHSLPQNKNKRCRYKNETYLKEEPPNSAPIQDECKLSKKTIDWRRICNDQVFAGFAIHIKIERRKGSQMNRFRRVLWVSYNFQIRRKKNERWVFLAWILSLNKAGSRNISPINKFIT